MLTRWGSGYRSGVEDFGVLHSRLPETRLASSDTMPNAHFYLPLCSSWAKLA